MPHYQLFYHIVWATKNRQQLITPDIEAFIYGQLRSKAISLGAVVYAINGAADHVHVVLTIPPSIAVGKFVGQIKAVASKRFNDLGRLDKSFYWQDDYSAFSFDAKRLPNYVAYVENQKAHHANDTLIPVLERTEGRLTMKEVGSIYAVEEADWRAEMEAM